MIMFPIDNISKHAHSRFATKAGAKAKEAKEAEHDAQCRIFAKLRHRLPRYGRRAFAIPNGARMGWKQWQRLQREGASAGVSDFQIPGPTPRGGYAGVAIELKKAKGGSKTSREQWLWLLYYASIGWLAARCRGYSEAMGVIEGAGYV